MLNEGVHFIHSAGNDAVKVEAASGIDYNNYVSLFVGTDGGGQPILQNVYYHTGSSPIAANSIEVGSINYVAYTSSLERRAYYSGFGTGVDVWAPGTGIISSYKTGAGSPYYYNNSFDQANDSGTSMASPQVAGVLALFLQLSPGASPTEGQKWITNNAITGALYDTSLTNDYTVSTSLGGGPNKFLFNPYAVSSIYPMKNGIVIKNGIVKLKS
jgi:subtilisin family serine protease